MLATASTPTTTNLGQSIVEDSCVDKSEVLLDNDDVVEVMRRKLSGKDFRIKNWSLDPVDGTNGFLGQYYHLRVACIVDNKNIVRYKFFAKTKPPINSPQYELAERANVFNKEIRVYEDLIPRMGRGVGPKWSADCYLGKENSIMVLEDATLEGYAMPDKYVPFGYEEWSLMLRSLAALHSRSLILDEKLRRSSGKTILEVYGEILAEGLFPCQDRSERSIIGPGIQGAREMVDLVEGLDDAEKSRVKNRITKWSWNIPKLLRPSKKYRNVVCHRDPWANNFMVKRNGIGNPSGWYLIDFQFSCYLPPAVDFMLSMYLNTRRKMRDELFETMTMMYHGFVAKELTSEGHDVEKLLSWREFRESCEAYRPLAIIYVTINQQIMLMDGESADTYFTKSPELLERVLWGSGRAELVCPMFARIREYRERITENLMEINEKLADDLIDP